MYIVLFRTCIKPGHVGAPGHVGEGKDMLERARTCRRARTCAVGLTVARAYHLPEFKLKLRTLSIGQTVHLFKFQHQCIIVDENLQKKLNE